MHIVLDTNVLVSGLQNPHGTQGRIVDLILDGRIHVLYDDRILAEYLETLARSELAIDPSLAQALVGHIRLSGERMTAPPLPKDTLTDADNLPFAEMAISGKAEALVTGNARRNSFISRAMPGAVCLARNIGGVDLPGKSGMESAALSRCSKLD